MVKKLPFFSVIVDKGEDDSGGYIITLVSSRLPASLQPVQRECILLANTRDVCAFMALIGQASVVNVVTDRLNSFRYVKEIRCVTASQQKNL